MAQNGIRLSEPFSAPCGKTNMTQRNRMSMFDILLHFHTVLRIKIHTNNPNYIIYWYMFTSSCFKSILLAFEDHAASNLFIDRKQKMFFIWMLWITIFMFSCSHYLWFVSEKLARVGVVLPPEGYENISLPTFSVEHFTSAILIC